MDAMMMMRYALVAGVACAMAAAAGGQSRPVPTPPPTVPSKVAVPSPVSPAWEQTAAEFAGTPTATKPSRDAEMRFPTSSEVAEIPVKGGQRVKTGDLLVRARDTEVKAAMEQQRALAQNDLEISGAEAQLELANIRFENLKKSQSYSPEEYDQRRIEARTSIVQRDQAVFNKDQQRLRLAQLEAQYERYRLIAPFDGIVEEVFVDLGQGVTEQDKVVRLVHIDRLWLDPTPPTVLTIEQDLKPGSKAWVLVDLPGKPQLVEGKVLEVSPVADSVSLTRRVRVEIENPKGWPAGTQAVVRFTAPATEAAAGPEDGSDAALRRKAVAGGISPR